MLENGVRHSGSDVVSANIDLERELAELIVTALNLEISADEIAPTLPLFKEGLSLDSIDALELALEVSQRYGVQLRSDDENIEYIFGSLRNLANYLENHRAR
jgi:acyl carrier protein